MGKVGYGFGVVLSGFGALFSGFEGFLGVFGRFWRKWAFGLKTRVFLSNGFGHFF